VLAAALALVSFLLMVPLNALTKELSVAALFVAGSYPFTKRFFAIPQAYLGIAFGFGIPMAFAAVQDHVPMLAWLMLLANVFWSVAYDTAYAMVDRDDDIKIGIRTSALTFGRYDVFAIMLCYALMLGLYLRIGLTLGFGPLYWLGWIAAAGCAIYHYTLIRTRDRMACFAAFRHNNWLGGALFAGIAAHYAAASF
jgi:4-hydroxybenzoate polyprenyltransferase